MSRRELDARVLAEEIRRKRLEAAGLADQYDLWRESLPDQRMPDGEAYDTFMRLQDAEESALGGRLSVTTGGAEPDTGTTVPTPGPDGEGGSPDEAGDTSEGGDEDPGDLKLVEGMWVPPKEAEAENYETPSTYQMSRSEEWTNNARVLHDFIYPKKRRVGAPFKKELSNMEVGDWARNELSGFNWNVVTTMDYAQKMVNANDPRVAIAFLNLINMYDHSEGGAADFAGAVGEIATDPTTYLGLGVGAVAAKGAAKTVAKTGLKKALQLAIVAGTAGAAEGGLIAGGFDLTKQQVEKEAGAREGIDYGQVGIATGVGATVGTVLGTSIGAYAGKKLDKLAEAIRKDRARVEARDIFLEERATQDLGEEHLMEILHGLQKADTAAEQEDIAVKMANRILGENDEVPRLKDGSIDYDSILRTIEEVRAEAGGSKIAPEEDLSKQKATLGKPRKDDPRPFRADIGDEESQKLAQKVLELKELEAGDVVLRTVGRPGSRVKDELGEMYEVVGRNKQGWYRLHDNLGRQKNMRRKQFEVVDKAPAPRKAGPMELDPFSPNAAKIMEMNERVLSPEHRLTEVKTTHKEQKAIVKAMEETGIDFTTKPIDDHWTPAELLGLRDTYNKQARGMADMARMFESQLRNEGRLLDSQLAAFNNAHAMFVATRDLFYGVSGNAARQLNILRSKPASGVYDFGQSMLDSISMQGGRANTERAIQLMADFASQKHTRGTKSQNATLSKLSENIWGNPKAAALLNIRYNMMLSSWRTHFFNFLGNSASGIYQHGMVSPVRMAINNLDYARELAWSKLAGGTKYGPTPDPADRITRHQWYAELRGHYASARDSLALAKEIAMGRDIGEGKVWNELGLRYNVLNIPDTAFGKLGTTPVRMLEAGDAFFKNQYYNSKMHELASIKARYDEVHAGQDYQTRYDYHLNENPTGDMERAAKDFAAKQTYTNDPNVYGGVLAAVAKGVSSAQNKSLMVNLIVPFVRTPANLLSYSMEMIGGNAVLSYPKTYNSIMHGTPRESQEALARLTVAAGLWLTVAEMHQNGDITGTGPTNWEEAKVWEAAGWQPNSMKIWGNWVSMDRAAPAGQSLSTIASVFDYYAMTQQEEKPAMEWIGAGLLYTADMIIDQNYLSTASDLITAIQSKETSRARSVGASMINSILVPNLLRDLRRPADPLKRSSTSTDLMSQVVAQMKNASPWHSSDLPPNRDWKGDPVHYFGNAYARGLIPFNLKNPDESDSASMALAYSRIPVSKPDKTISWPKGRGDAIDLFAMDNGKGYVYDKYLEIMGQNRLKGVNELMKTPYWRKLVKKGEIGPGSEGDYALRKALGMGSKFGRLGMLQWLIEHSGENNTYTRVNPEGKDETFIIQHPVSPQKYVELRKMVRRQGYKLTDEEKQYMIKQPTEGPEFFKP